MWRLGLTSYSSGSLFISPNARCNASYSSRHSEQTDKCCSTILRPSGIDLPASSCSANSAIRRKTLLAVDLFIVGEADEPQQTF